MQKAEGGTQPLSPEQMAELLITQRGFLSSPSGPKDAYRKQPATLPADMNGPGAPVGKGYETFAIIQLLNRRGERVELALGAFDLKDLHAEAHAIRALRRVWEKHGTPDLAQGRMLVVVDQTVCGDDTPNFTSCTTRLIDFARELRLAGLDIYLPRRDRMIGDGLAGAKTSVRTATMADRPELKVLPELFLRFQGLDAVKFFPSTSTMRKH